MPYSKNKTKQIGKPTFMTSLHLKPKLQTLPGMASPFLSYLCNKYSSSTYFVPNSLLINNSIPLIVHIFFKKKKKFTENKQMFDRFCQTFFSNTLQNPWGKELNYYLCSQFFVNSKVLLNLQHSEQFRVQKLRVIVCFNFIFSDFWELKLSEDNIFILMFCISK